MKEEEGEGGEKVDRGKERRVGRKKGHWWEGRGNKGRRGKKGGRMEEERES